MLNSLGGLDSHWLGCVRRVEVDSRLDLSTLCSAGGYNTVVDIGHNTKKLASWTGKYLFSLFVL